jgi:1-acyl-sn-glycerol-3-phosphate acyltransferase
MAEQDLAQIKAQKYKDDRPADLFAPVHERARTHEANWVYEAVRLVLTPVVMLLFRGRCISSDKVPAAGPVILAPNHFSNMDHFFMAAFIRRRVSFVAKSQLFFQNPILDKIFIWGGVLPIRRGHRDEESFITMRKVLERGGAIVMYAEGGRSRTGDLSDKVKPGIGRLALETGAPVVPVAIYGSAKVRNWKRLQMPKVTVQYGDAFRFEKVENPTREQQQAAAEEIFTDVRTLYTALKHAGRKGMVRRIREQRRAERRAARRTQPA